MTSPSVRGINATTNFSTAATSFSCALPATVVAGDTILLWLTWGVTGQTNPVTWPAGFTQFMFVENTSGATEGMAAAWKKATGSEGGTNVTVSVSTSTKASSGSMVIQAAADPTVRAPEATTVTSVAVNPDPPSISPTGGSKDYLFVALSCISGVTSYSADPASYSGWGSGQTTGGGAATNTTWEAAWRQATTATENPGVFTNSNGVANCTTTIAVHPAAAPGPPLATRRNADLVRQSDLW